MTLLESSVPGMNGNAVRQQVADIAEALNARAAALATDLAQAIVRDVGLYQTIAPLPFEVVVDGCAANMRSVLEAIAANRDFDASAASALGMQRARDGVPLAAVMEAYRIGFREIWDAAFKESAVRDHNNGEALQILTAKIFAAQDIYTSAMATAYRDEQSRQVLSDESERSVLIDSVLHGRLFEQSSVWEAADYLRLPSQGPFVVIAAEVPMVGAEALPEIESKLRSMDVYSAWRLLPDLQVGVVHIKSDKALDHVLALVSRTATDRVGVSARFDDLRETAQALRLARVMLRGHPEPGQRVSSFDGSLLATAAVSAPEIMVRLVSPIIERFAELGDNERDVLFDTFRVWLENDGSLRTAGELLFCHPNTVRYRLHRIEQRTERSLTRPRDVAELSLAFEVYRRLMWQPEKRHPQKHSR